MTEWGIFEVGKEVHIMPIYSEEGEVLEGHEFSAKCPCRPILDTDSLTGWVWVHREDS